MHLTSPKFTISIANYYNYIFQQLGMYHNMSHKLTNHLTMFNKIVTVSNIISLKQLVK